MQQQQQRRWSEARNNKEEKTKLNSPVQIIVHQFCHVAPMVLLSLLLHWTAPFMLHCSCSFLHTSQYLLIDAVVSSFFLVSLFSFQLNYHFCFTARRVDAFLSFVCLFVNFLFVVFLSCSVFNSPFLQFQFICLLPLWNCKENARFIYLCNTHIVYVCTKVYYTLLFASTLLPYIALLSLCAEDVVCFVLPFIYCTRYDNYFCVHWLRCWNKLERRNFVFFCSCKTNTVSKSIWTTHGLSHLTLLVNFSTFFLRFFFYSLPTSFLNAL